MNFSQNRLKKFSLVFLLTCFTTIAVAKLSVVTVEVDGMGATKNDASLDALTQAISQVNGVQIASQLMSSVREQSNESSTGSSSELTESFAKDIQSMTKGVVESWSILSAKQEPQLGNQWVVNISASVSKYKTSKQLKRLRMAIVPFRFAEESPDEDSEKFRRAFTRNLENYLTQSRRFAMLDRDFMREQTQELNFVASSGVATAELARLGNRVGTDYLIVGEVEGVSVKSRKRTMQSTGQTMTTTTATGTVSYRIIDVATTQIKFSDTMGISISSNLANKAGRQLADRAGQIILNAIYPIRILSTSGDSVTLGQGGKTVKKGMKYKVVRLGKRLVDPYTKESIGREEVEVGLVRVTDVQAKSSTAKILNLKAELRRDNLVSGLIIRPIIEEESSAEAKAAASVKKVKAQGKQAIKDIEKSSEDEW